MVVEPRAPVGVPVNQRRTVWSADAGITGGALARPAAAPPGDVAGVTGVVVDGERRTTVRGGSTDHAVGSDGAPDAVDGRAGAGPRPPSGLVASASSASALADSAVGRPAPSAADDEPADDEPADDEPADDEPASEKPDGDQLAAVLGAGAAGRHAPRSVERRTGERAPGRDEASACCEPGAAPTVERRSGVPLAAAPPEAVRAAPLVRASAPIAGPATGGVPVLRAVDGFTATGASSATV
ncbi:hypothetical protein CPE01_28080 [Cellulomonas persica]|uniref:Uncharacterized protein n=1 Tax=Cellulomonas persica TaxID=76861 RepID=A0A510V1U4_9CELL|nr:hypothetical protein CPE01_28080 [Cellulomonas persica]